VGNVEVFNKNELTPEGGLSPGLVSIEQASVFEGMNVEMKDQLAKYRNVMYKQEQSPPSIKPVKIMYSGEDSQFFNDYGVIDAESTLFNWNGGNGGMELNIRME